MAVLYWDAKDKDELFQSLKANHIYVVGKKTVTFDEDDTKVKFLNIPNSKGLEFQLVAIMGGRITEHAKTDVEAAKLLYVAMTRATSQLIMTTVEFSQ